MNYVSAGFRKASERHRATETARRAKDTRTRTPWTVEHCGAGVYTLKRGESLVVVGRKETVRQEAESILSDIHKMGIPKNHEPDRRELASILNFLEV